MRLEKISQDNVWDVAKLKVSKDQERFVASNVESILEAFAVREDGYVALPFALYEEDTLVGFCMLGYGGIGDDEEPEIVYGNYSIWRLMIGSSFQGKGRCGWRRDCGSNEAIKKSRRDYLREIRQKG